MFCLEKLIKFRLDILITHVLHYFKLRFKGLYAISK